ncbi:MAG TPA: hypothetical protein PKD37_05725 [Oligoflexia bacterium]|nr:hypothetical protein [Oligoflexia bacterium]HMP27463.1 hypothetical protein [Oligoflexia bacterium]
MKKIALSTSIIIAIITLALGWSLFIVEFVLANNQTEPAVTIEHQPRELTQPALPLQLSAVVNGTTSANFKLLALLKIDGKFHFELVEKYGINSLDQQTFSLEIPAPLRQIEYTFYLLKNGDLVARSQKFKLERKCAPEIQIVDSKTEPIQDHNEKLKLLIEKAARLEIEVAQYEYGLKLLSEIREILSQ